MKRSTAITALILSLAAAGSTSADPGAAHPDAVYDCAATTASPARAPSRGYAEAQRHARGRTASAYVRRCGVESRTGNDNIVSQAAKAAKKQAEAEVRYEARRRVRGAFNSLFRR